MIRKFVSLLICSILIIPFCNTVQAQNTDSTKADIANIEINYYNDGPHVFWQNDTTAIVFYLCNESISKDTFYSTDTIRFNGLCDDSNIEYVIPINNYSIAPYEFKNVSKILAVSDIHGEYEYLRDILFNAKVIDSNQNWIYGDGYLVIDGDIFDRGDMVTECLWLIYRLEIQARQQGGMVHFTLGNHELMILQGDNRYINEKYLDGIVKKSRIEYIDLYGPDMELGRWLRTKNTAVIINDILFVHGGISPSFVEKELKLEWLNKTVRDIIDFNSAQIAFDSTAKYILGSYGPFWYRGYHYEMENRYPQITMAEVDRQLEYFGVDAIVVGHTEIDSLMGLYDNKIYALDIPFDELNGLQALLWQDNKFYRVSVDGSQVLIK
ncbi:MAG: metallophosphoesterase [bacterium]